MCVCVCMNQCKGVEGGKQKGDAFTWYCPPLHIEGGDKTNEQCTQRHIVYMNKQNRERGGKGIKGREQRQDESEVKQTNPLGH